MAEPSSGDSVPSAMAASNLATAFGKSAAVSIGGSVKETRARRTGAIRSIASRIAVESPFSGSSAQPKSEVPRTLEEVFRQYSLMNAHMVKKMMIYFNFF